MYENLMYTKLDILQIHAIVSLERFPFLFPFQGGSDVTVATTELSAGVPAKERGTQKCITQLTCISPADVWSQKEVDLLAAHLRTRVCRNEQHPDVLLILGDPEVLALRRVLGGKGFCKEVLSGNGDPQLKFPPPQDW